MQVVRPRPWTIAAILFALLLVLLLGWLAGWFEKKTLSAAGGLYFPLRLELDVPRFAQADPRWAADRLGTTSGSLAAEGCAVAAAAMVLAYHGVDTDPGRLNAFLTELPGGYTERGWIYWEKAAEFAPAITDALLPHYEDEPSHALIDWNLLRGNPVIVRLRQPNGMTHFVVVCGKDGFDYLVQDPGRMGERGVYPLHEYGSPIEALRFYRPLSRADPRNES